MKNRNFLSFFMCLALVGALLLTSSYTNQPQTTNLGQTNKLLPIRMNGSLTGNYGGCTFTFGIQITFNFVAGAPNPITNVNVTVTSVSVNCGSGTGQGYARVDNVSFDEANRTFSDITIVADGETDGSRRIAVESQQTKEDIIKYCEGQLSSYSGQ